jgi:hypothetical protein
MKRAMGGAKIEGPWPANRAVGAIAFADAVFRNVKRSSLSWIGKPIHCERERHPLLARKAKCWKASVPKGLLFF